MKAALSLKKVLLNTHIYGGLLCFSYLLIFGISSLNFNHPYAFTKATGATTTWRQNVSLPDLGRVTAAMPVGQGNSIKSKNNEQVRQALHLFGFNSPWRSHWKDAGIYHAVIIRPGKQYEVDVHVKENLAVVAETRANPLAVVKQLHGFGGKMPGAAFMAAWGWYTELCVFTVLFSAGSGIYLWTRRKHERRLGLIMLTSAFAVSLALMLYITLHG